MKELSNPGGIVLSIEADPGMEAECKETNEEGTGEKF
jgi:hypothetical protein